MPTCFNCFCEGYEIGYTNCCGNLFDLLTCGLFDCSRICNRCFNKDPINEEPFEYLYNVIKARRYRIAQRILNSGVDINVPERILGIEKIGVNLVNSCNFDVEQLSWIIDRGGDVNMRRERVLLIMCVYFLCYYFSLFLLRMEKQLYLLTLSMCPV